MTTTYAMALCRILKMFGVDTAFGMVGGYIYDEGESLCLSGFKVYNCSHEEGAAFSALEYSLCTDKMTVAFSTAGPALFHSMNGLRAARLEGGKIIYIGGFTSYEHTGKWEGQPTSADFLKKLVDEEGEGVFNKVIIIREQEDFKQLIEYLKNNSDNLCGFVVGVFMLSSVQKKHYENFDKTEKEITEFFQSKASHKTEQNQDRNIEQYARQIADELKLGQSILWNGYGTRHAAQLFTRLAEATGSKVMSTPRGKGVFPEKHPLYIGSTGLGAYTDNLKEIIKDKQVKSIIIWGTRLGEFSTSYIQKDFPSDKQYYYIGLEPDKAKNNLPAGTVSIQAEIGSFLSLVLSYLDIDENKTTEYHYVSDTPDSAPASRANRVNPEDVMAIIQKKVVDETDCLVASEPGNAFSWTSRYLKMPSPNRHRLSTMWCSMGHYACGLVGLAASGHQALGVIGDGSMLMVNELATAAKYNLPAIWLILNDGYLNMVQQALDKLHFTEFDCTVPQVDFAAYAQSVGAKGFTARNLPELEVAITEALVNKGPAVIDVWTDHECPAPTEDRFKSLQG